MMNGNFRRQRAQKGLIILAVLAGTGAFLYWYFFHSLSLKELFSIRHFSENFSTAEIRRYISAPPPLRREESAASSPLTPSGIIANTNIQRNRQAGLPALSENPALDDIAGLRLDDMFRKQYFAHTAPDGGNAEMAAGTVGYDYIAIGENLALGRFAGDKGVVAGWMNSPGHRANILSAQLTQIGAAAREGMFNGEYIWIAVQVFGRPASECPLLSAGLKTQIDNSKNRLSLMETEIQAMRAELGGMKQKYGPAYNQNARKYNQLIDQYNALLAETKADVFEYNQEVTAFNQCLG
ncbi:MAG: CAP domain-containing protein [Candidatus Liptonbacteria bacterium]|nr:CAP domain-containing protein [Candidatus Liptonbacteria bacterium]